MPNPNNQVAGWIADASGVAVAIIMTLGGLVQFIRWAVNDRHQVDLELASIKRDVQELRLELRREGVQPCRGVTKARELTEQISTKLDAAKAITSRHPEKAPPADQGEWGE